MKIYSQAWTSNWGFVAPTPEVRGIAMLHPRLAACDVRKT